MKLKPYFLLAAIIVFIYSCSKKDMPQPNPTTPTDPPNDPPVQIATLSIKGFSPKSAAIGTTIIIKGTAFGTDTNAVKIGFAGTTWVKPKAVVDTSITLIVPRAAQSGKLKVTLKTDTVTSSDSFTLTQIALPQPVIVSFAPTIAKVGAKITIVGNNFGTDTTAVKVAIGGAAAKITSLSNTFMQVLLPENAKTGKVSVMVAGASPALSSGTFTVDQSYLSINSFTPSIVGANDTLTVNGTFGTVATNLHFYFSTRTITLQESKIISFSPTQLKVIVPSNAFTGTIKIISDDNYPYNTITSTTSITYMDHLSINSADPASARAGEIIMINSQLGSSESVANINILFAGSTITVHPLKFDQHNNMFVRVPPDAKSGKISVAKSGYLPGLTANTLTLLADLPVLQQGKWVQRPDFASRATFFAPSQYPKMGAISFTINNIAYIGCGTTNAPFDGYGSSDMWAFDGQYEAWMQIADFGGGTRAFGVAFSVGSKGYVGTGINGQGNATSDFWEYDPDQNVWVQKADFKGTPRGYATAFAAGNYGYIGSGGTPNGGGTSDFYKYDPSANSWSQIASLPGARKGAFSLVVNNQAYVGGGGTSYDFYSYSAINNNWTAKANVPYLGYGSSSFTIGGKGYVGLGFSGSAPTTLFYQYDATANSWSKIADYAGQARYFAVAFTLNNAGYVGLGAATTYNNAYKDFWAYKP